MTEQWAFRLSKKGNSLKGNILWFFSGVVTQPATMVTLSSRNVQVFFYPSAAISWTSVAIVICVTKCFNLKQKDLHVFTPLTNCYQFFARNPFAWKPICCIVWQILHCVRKMLLFNWLVPQIHVMSPHRRAVLNPCNHRVTSQVFNFTTLTSHDMQTYWTLLMQGKSVQSFIPPCTRQTLSYQLLAQNTSLHTKERWCLGETVAKCLSC